MFVKILILMCHVLLVVLSEECVTPNGEKAQCISLCSCPILLNSLVDFKAENIEFMKKSQCGHAENHPLVCCGSSASYVTSTIPAVSVLQDKLKLIPSRRFCGYQRYDDYIHTKRTFVNSSIDEFPWVATLRYATVQDEDAVYCVGSLINNRYVLTTAHCLLPRVDRLGTVQLGEFNIIEEKDCIKNEQFDECADPIENYGIEELIIHENFDRRHKQNDIGLIRLNRTVFYTDYIRPICLPFPGTRFAKDGDIVVHSGWGAIQLNGESSNIKKKIRARLLPLQNCTSEFKEVNVTEAFSCTVEVESKDTATCYRDSGGPVMFSRRNQWHQEAIVAYGKACGFGSTLNVRVSCYLDWILKNIKP